MFLVLKNNIKKFKKEKKIVFLKKLVKINL